MSKPQWICAVCAEDFTRKSSAKRHMNNVNIHRKKPLIVRYVDYIIARIKGDYPQPIITERLQRRKINNKLESHNQTFTHDYNNSLNTRMISSSELDPVNHVNVHPSMTKDVDFKNSTLDSDTFRQRLPKSTDALEGWPRGKPQTTLSSKFEEIKKLLSSCYSSEIINTVLANLAQYVLYDGGNDRVVDQYLIKIRQNFNQLQALDYLLSSKSSITRTRTNIAEQDAQQESCNIPFRDISVDEAAAIKLTQIKLLLAPHYPQQFVMSVITGLIRKYNSTGDSTFLDEAFERHYANIRRRPMRQ
jgi:hypothetical protein